MSQADELENRLIDFAVRIIKIANSLPSSAVGKQVARQLRLVRVGSDEQ